MGTKKLDSDVEFIKALSEILRENDLTEIEVSRDYGESDSIDVRVAREIMVAPAAPVAVAAPVAPAPVAAAAPAAPQPEEDPALHAGAVTSPMVGTVYLSAEPGVAPFVSVGDKVTEGQTLLIIEAMKTMNQIPSPHSGVVKRVLVDDSATAEYGTPLMIIE
ncbi:MAG: acetyl-CoA carboxylase biotin carboxyl carrier protein [Rhodobacteraceae bacterium]|nr:acetyl-CoA carboxylase biotin carboxyl carrier protein [Paracoccaceae bacterium]